MLCFRCKKNEAVEGRHLCAECIEKARQIRLEKRRKYTKTYEQRHPEKIAEKRRVYWKQNKERLCKLQKTWREAHPNYGKEWRDAHPGYINPKRKEKLQRKVKNMTKIPEGAMCTKCGKAEHIPGRSLCRECYNEHCRELYNKRMKGTPLKQPAKLCAQCHQHPVTGTRAVCAQCQRENKAQYRVQRALAKKVTAASKKTTANAKDKELCIRCGKNPRAPRRRICAECIKAEIRASFKRYYHSHLEQERARVKRKYHVANPDARYKVSAEEYKELVTLLDYKISVIQGLTKERDALKDSLEAASTNLVTKDTLIAELEVKLKHAEERLKISERMLMDSVKSEADHMDEIAVLKDQLNEFQAFPTAEVTVKEPIQVEVKQSKFKDYALVILLVVIWLMTLIAGGIGR